MISLIGIGTTGENIVSFFKEHKEYNIFKFSKNQKNGPYTRCLKHFSTAEKCEDNVPNLKKYKTIDKIQENVQIFVCGSSFSANYTLGLLEQIKDKKIEIFYIKPDVDLLIGDTKLQERAIFGVLQEYSRSGCFKSFTIISNPALEKMIGSVPIKKYFSTLNKAIYYGVHYINLFSHIEPIIGNLSDPSEIQRIRSIGRIDPENLKENWFFELDNTRDVCYFICINKERLENDGELHYNIIQNLKQKPRNAFKNVTYAIYESPYENDFGYCVAHTNAIQTNP